MRPLTGVTWTMAVVLTLVVIGPSAAAQECSCSDAFVGDTIAAADGVFIGTVASGGDGAERTTYEVGTWIKGDLATEAIEVGRGDCDAPVAAAGEEAAVAIVLDSGGRAVHACALPSPAAVLALAQPEQASAGPAVYFATSAIAPPLLLDADAGIVASDPGTDNRRIDAAAACPDGTIAYLQDQQVVIIDADFTEIDRLQFRRITDELFCPEPGVVLAVAGPALEQQVYDVRSRSPLTGQLAPDGPADAVGDLVAVGAQGPGEANATVRVVGRGSGIERTLIDPALLVGARPVSLVSVALSPSADRAAFAITSGPEDNQQATVMITDTAGGSILALADLDAIASEVRWLSGERLLVRATSGRSTVHSAATLAVESEIDAPWAEHLDGNVLTGIGGTEPGVGTTLTRIVLPDGAPTVERELPFEMQVIRLPEPVESGATGSAFLEPLALPLPSDRLDGLVALTTDDGQRFVAPDELPTPTPPANQDESAGAPPTTRDPDGEDAGILMWAVVAGAIAIGGVLLILARRPQPG